MMCWTAFNLEGQPMIDRFILDVVRAFQKIFWQSFHPVPTVV